MDHKPHQVKDEDLRGCVVMACHVNELGALIEDVKRELAIQQRITDGLVQVLKAFGDLYIELTGEAEHRKFLSKTILKAEREATRLRLPTWFWRPEPGRSLQSMLFTRARFLIHDHQCHVDDVWSLLREFAADYANQDISDRALTAIIKQAYVGRE